MTQTFVALDLETTGLDLDRDGITEIGAVRFTAEDGLLETFQSLVNPGRSIPAFVEALTGISTADIAGAPRLAELSGPLRRFVGDSALVGHNLRFDVDFLARKSIVFANRTIDTLRLHRLLFPGREARSLGELANQLGVVVTGSHRALADAQTAAQVMLSLRRHLAALPHDRRDELARLIALDDPYLAESVAGFAVEGLPALTAAISTLRPPREVSPLAERPDAPRVNADEVIRVFSAGVDQIEGFEERTEQLDMAAAVNAGFADGGHWLIEAGTGVGKSLAYIVPAALHALRHGERVVISTNTINLQEQLFDKDIPAARAMLVDAGVIEHGDQFQVAILKGRSNYLCLSHWASTYGLPGDADLSHLHASLSLWLPQTETGDRGELSLDNQDFAAWSRVSAEGADCLSRGDHFVKEGECFLLRARKKAEAAHLLIVNHALLLSDLASGGSALPPYDRLIIDEAHNLEDTATRQFGGAISLHRTNELLDKVDRHAGQRSSGIVPLLRKAGLDDIDVAALRLEAAVNATRTSAQIFFAEVLRLFADVRDDEQLLVTPTVRQSEPWESLEELGRELDERFAAVDQLGVEAAKLATESGHQSADIVASDVESVRRTIAEIRGRLGAILAKHDESTIVWAGKDRDGTGTINSAPLDVGPVLWDRLFSPRTTIIATSATLAAGDGMDYAARRLGLEEPQTLTLGSPFDYLSNALLATVNDIPEPGQPRYYELLATSISELTVSSGGRALALFTSYQALNRTAALIEESLRAEGITVLSQGRDGTPRQLIQKLREDPKTIVLGTASFWEGVDVRGEALSLLIIARLPFAVPTDPIHKSRSERLDNPFVDYALPAAILRFRQGFGRLIRARNDRGVVAVLDRRFFEKNYGKQFAAAVPKCTRIHGGTRTVAAKVGAWLWQEE